MEPDKSSRRKLWTVLGLALAAVLIVSAVLIGTDSGRNEVTTYVMGSYMQQTVYGRGGEEAAREAAHVAVQLEDAISWRIENSDIQRLNSNAGGEFINIEKNIYGLLTLGMDVWEQSGGGFDLTIAPVSRLWDFDSQLNQVPDKKRIEQFLEYVNGGDLKLGLNNTAALYREGNALDLGAMGKGAACDAAVEVYKNHDIKAAILSVGGSVGCYGKKLFGDSWKVAVRNPNAMGAMGQLELEGGFLSTSGNYEKSFEQDGVLYHHLLDPSTGYPADSGLKSVTVLSASGALSDALSTACFVLGYEGGLELLEIYEAQGIFIFEDNTVAATSGLKNTFEITDSSFSWAEAE